MNAALVVAAVSFAYFALLRTYGFQVEDEGTLLFWLDRIAHGQVPYVDFHTGYTPGYFYLCAALLKIAGSVQNLRIFVALVNAGTAGAMYLLARRYVGAWMAAIAPAIWVAFIPVYVGEFAAFNVPYPAWLAALAWVLLALALLDFAEKGRVRALCFAGAAAAAAFAFKPNAGAFALAASTWVIASTARDTSTVDRALGFVAAALMGLGVWFAFGGAVWGPDALVHLAPLAVLLVLACGPLASLYTDSGHPRTTRALLVLGGVFAALTASWALPLAFLLGPQRFATEVLLIGSGAAELYHEALPAPEPYALIVVAAVLAAVAGGALAKSWRASPLSLLGLGAVAAAAGGWWLARHALMPEGPLASVSLQLQNAAFWLAPLTNWTGVAMLAAAAGRFRPLGDERRMAVLVPCAVAMYWQLYPRTDFMHVIMAAPLTLVLAVRLLERVRDWWTQGAWPTRLEGTTAVAAILAAVVLAVVALQTAPVIAAALQAPFDAPAADLPRVCARLEPDAADDLAAYAHAARFLAEHTQPGEPVLPFPALAGVLFAAGLTNPVPHDYWFPGRPSHEDERAMLEQLRAAPPRLIATLNDGWWFFADAPNYFTDTRAFVVQNYALVGRFGRYDVLARREVASGLPRVVEPVPPGPMEQVYQPYYGRRVQAVRRWMAGVTPADARKAELPADAARAILLLRGIRDAGDLRAAAWVLAGLRSPSLRVRADARDAARKVAERFGATRLRWANDFDPASYQEYVRPYEPDARVLAGGAAPEPRALAQAMLYVLAIPQ